MTTPSTESSFHRFFDDAAVFPPGLAPLAKAVEEHVRYSQDPVAREFIGPLVLPLDKIEEAVSLADGTSLGVSVVVIADRLPEVSALTKPSLIIEAVEVKVGNDAADDISKAAAFRAQHPDTDVFVELPAVEVTDDSVAELKRQDLALKFRTGGIKKHLFPSAGQLVDVLDTTVRAGLPFKLTAGLHRAMRYTDTATGFEHFGFLNIAAATAALRNGRGRQTALDLLDTDNAKAVTVETMQDPHWRDSFRSFGTCSLGEPTQTLGDIDQLGAESVNAF